VSWNQSLSKKSQHRAVMPVKTGIQKFFILDSGSRWLSPVRPE
jgi:hypothetical protein